MKKALKFILVLSMFIVFPIFGLHGHFKSQTQDLCIKVSQIIRKNGSLNQIKIVAVMYQFESSGNGINQVLFFKLYTISGVCIITLKNGKPINAQYNNSA